MSLNNKYAYFIILLLCLLSGCLSKQPKSVGGQQSRADSIIGLYHDTTYTNPGRARSIFEKAKINVTDSIDYYKLTLYIGICYYQIYNMDSAMLLNDEVLKFNERVPSSASRMLELMAYAYNYRGVFLQEMGKRDSAILYLGKAYQALYRTGLRDKLPDVCINLADNYAQNGNFPQATGYYRKALILADSLGIGKKVNHAIYYGLARIYADINNYAMAESYYQLAEKSFMDITLYEQYNFANTRGNYYYIIKNYPKALFWFYKANAISKKLSLKTCQAITESNLGEVHLLMNRADSAKYYLDKAGKVFLTDEANSSVRFYFNGLYASLALQKNDLAEAGRLLLTPYDENEINPTYVYLHNKRLEELYRKKGDFKNAYLRTKQVEAYDDSLRNVKTLSNIAEIDSRYRQDTTLLKRDVVIAQEKSKSLYLRNISIISVSLLLLLFLSAVIVTIYAKKKKEQRYARQVATITKLRMENIRNRISPHHIFNVLNAVMPALRQHEDLASPLNILVKSIRKSLVISEQIAIPLDQEIDFVKEYLELRKSIGTLLPAVEWLISPGVNMHSIIPSMIIQIPVENAVKYAFDSVNDENLLRIKIAEETDSLVISVEDNGVGFIPEKHNGNFESTGTGLKVLYRTIEVLNSRNHEKIIFSIQNRNLMDETQKGTKVTIIIPPGYNFKL